MKLRTWFILALWLLMLVPLAMFWGIRPFAWAQRHGFVTAEEARNEFPIHFATMPPSKMQQHLTRLETEDSEEGMEFDVTDWSLREMRYRLALLFVVWSASGLFVNWFAGAVIRGNRDLE